MEKQEKGMEFTYSPCLEYAFNYSMQLQYAKTKNLPLLGIQGRLEEVIWNRALKVIRAKKPGTRWGKGPVVGSLE